MSDTQVKLTREERIELLRKRQKRDGTPFAKHEGPRLRRKVSPDGLALALSVLPDDDSKIKVLQSFGADGRKALKELIEARPELAELYKSAFPRTRADAAGRPLANRVRATASGHAVVSGFKAGYAVDVQRVDGVVTLTQTDMFVEAQAREAKEA